MSLLIRNQLPVRFSCSEPVSSLTCAEHCKSLVSGTRGMDSESNRELEECVLRILKHGDPNKLTESKVRKLAADETGFDLTDLANRKLVKRTVENYFLNSQEDGSHHKKAVQTKERELQVKQPPQNPGRRRNLILDDDEDEEEAETETNDTRSSGNPEESEQPDASVESDEEDKRTTTKKRRADDAEDEGLERVNGKKRTVQRLSESKNFPNGDHPVCELSKNRFVVIQNFNGKTLVSIREYYEKDGQLLPTRKGISLTVEQWQAFKEGISDIEAGIIELKA